MKKLFIFAILLVSILWAKAPHYERGSLVIKLKDASQASKSSTGDGDLDTRLKALGFISIQPRFNTSRKSELSRIFRLEISPEYDPLGLANALKNHPAIEYAEPLYIDEILEAPDDTHYSASLNFAALQAEAAWEIHKCKQNPVIIAIVDTGVSWKHPDLGANIWNNLGEDANGNGYTMYHNGSAWVMDSGDLDGMDNDGNGKIDDLIGWNFMQSLQGGEDNNPADPGSHGTRVAGLAGAHTNNGIGVASLSWNPILMPISCSPPGATSSVYRGYEALVYAAENGAHVINCSWGGTNHSRANQDAIQYALSLGSIVVAAAGNSNNSIPIYPAAYPGVVAIASLMNNGTRWSGSNYGIYVDAGAPNESVYSTTGTSSYNISTGATSYASPIGAALLALIRSQNPSWSNAQVINQFKSTCDNIDAQNPGKEGLLGGGKLNAYRALSEINPTQTPELKLSLFQQKAPSDANMNGAVEPGESFSFNFVLRNYSDFSADATLSLSSSSSRVIINQNSRLCTLPADDFLELNNAFSVQVLPDTPSGFINFTLNISSALPINSSSFSLQILVHNGGSFVWEAKASARNQSGAYIKNALQAKGKEVVYGTLFPGSFLTFEAVYLSFGAVDANIARFNDPAMFYAIKNYLESGGNLYLEGADALGFDLATYFPLIDGIADGHEILWPLLGIASGEDGETHTLAQLMGQPGPTHNLLYTSSNQTNYDYIDRFQCSGVNAVSAFIESGYGTVGIAAAGGYDQRTFIFSYALAELPENAKGNTRLDLLERIIDFYEADEPTLSVMLSSFNAFWQDAATLVWHTASETELAGWNIYRGEDNALANALRLNTLQIPASGSTSQGSRYKWQDIEAKPHLPYYYWLEAVGLGGIPEYFGPRYLAPQNTESAEIDPPSSYNNSLFTPYPNPFNSDMIIPYQIAKGGTVELRLYDLKGRKIKEVNRLHPDAGNYLMYFEEFFSGKSKLQSGTYILEMRMDNYQMRRKIVLQK